MSLETSATRGGNPEEILYSVLSATRGADIVSAPEAILCFVLSATRGADILSAPEAILCRETVV